LDCGKKFLFLRFSYKIELIPVKFLRDSCEIPTFQTGPYLAAAAAVAIYRMLDTVDISSFLVAAAEKLQRAGAGPLCVAHV